MKLNKTLASALLLSVALTGCNNMVQNENATDENAPVVEENKKDETVEQAEPTETTEDTTAEEADKAETEETTDEAATKETSEDEASEEEATEEVADTSNLSIEEKIEALEQAIFDNRSSARAVELLFELSPETANENADVLNELLENSNNLLEQAQTALDELKAA